MSATTLLHQHPLPPPEAIRERIEAAEDELRALKRLLRAINAARQAEQARQRRLSAIDREGATHA
jgi:hypothetical protein